MGNLNNMPSVTQPGKRLRVSPNHNLCTYHADLRDYVRVDEGGSCGGRAFQAEATRRQRPRDVKKKMLVTSWFELQEEDNTEARIT